jgi:hypothetical protein
MKRRQSLKEMKWECAQSTVEEYHRDEFAGLQLLVIWRTPKHLFYLFDTSDIINREWMNSVQT